MDNDEQKPPVSPKSPMSLPASMELSQKSPMSLPAPLPVELELLGVVKEATAAELFERAEAQRIAEAPGACPTVLVVSCGLSSGRSCRADVYPRGPAIQRAGARERTSLVRGGPRAD